jgi:PhnB protein
VDVQTMGVGTNLGDQEYIMAAQYKGVPEGASAIIPRLVCRDVEAQIEFCCEALGAVEALRRPGPGGRAAHAMLKFGPAMLMLEAESPTLPSQAPNADGSSPVVIYLYVEDVDATVERALKRGGKLVVPVETHFWGDRTGWVQDPANHMWTIATRVEETTEDQRRERWSKIMSEKG